MNYIKDELTRLYKQADSNKWAPNLFNVEELNQDVWVEENTLAACKDVIDTVTEQVLTEWAQFLTENNIWETSYFVNPSYYRSRDISFRGLEERETRECLNGDDYDDDFIGHTLDAYSEYMEWDREAFIRQLPTFLTDEYHKEVFGKLDITILAPVKKGYGDIDAEQVDISWGNTKIMSPADWTKLEEFMDANDIFVEEYSDLVWHDVTNHEETMLNILEAIDEEIFCACWDIVYNVQLCMDMCELRGQALGIVIEDVFKDDSISYTDKLDIVKNKTSDYCEELADKMYDDAY